MNKDKDLSLGTQERHRRAVESGEKPRLGFRAANEYAAEHVIFEDTRLLEKLLFIGAITQEQCDAGLQLYLLYLQANMLPRTTWSYDPLSTGPAEISEREDAAKRKLRKVLKKLYPLDGVAEDICFHEKIRGLKDMRICLTNLIKYVT